MISLRSYLRSDARRLSQLADNPKVSQYLIYSFPSPYTVEDARWWIELGAHENGAINQAILYGQEMVGCIGIQPQKGWRAHVAEIGYWIGEPYWGRGIATAAVREMTRRAMQEWHYRKVYAQVLGPNKASMQVLEKSGYQLEGVMRCEVVKDDHLFDLHYYSCLSELLDVQR